MTQSFVRKPLNVGGPADVRGHDEASPSQVLDGLASLVKRRLRTCRKNEVRTLTCEGQR